MGPVAPRRSGTPRGEERPVPLAAESVPGLGPLPSPARPPRPGRLTLVGLRQRVLPFQVLHRLSRPGVPRPLPGPQQKEKEQWPEPVPSPRAPPPPLPPGGSRSRRHLSHRRPFIKEPALLPNPLACRTIGPTSHWLLRVPAPAGEYLTDWLPGSSCLANPGKGRCRMSRLLSWLWSWAPSGLLGAEWFLLCSCVL